MSETNKTNRSIGRVQFQATQGFDVVDLAPDDHFARDCKLSLTIYRCYGAVRDGAREVLLVMVSIFHQYEFTADTVQYGISSTTNSPGPAVTCLLSHSDVILFVCNSEMFMFPATAATPMNVIYQTRHGAF